MTNNLLYFIYTIQKKIEDIYIHKIISEILKIQTEYHLLSEKELEKLWTKMKEVITYYGIKKILLNNYLFIIYRSFLKNIGLYYIYKKNKLKKNNLLYVYSHEFFSIQIIVLILEFVNRHLNYRIGTKDLIFLLMFLNDPIKYNKNLINNQNQLYFHYFLFLYNNICNTNYVLITKTQKNSFAWLLKQTKNLEYINIQTITKIKQNYLQHLFNTQNNKYEINQSFFYEQEFFNNYQWKKQIFFTIDQILYKTHLTNKKQFFPAQINLTNDVQLFKTINNNTTIYQIKHPHQLNNKILYQLYIQNNQQFKNKLLWKNYIPFFIEKQKKQLIDTQIINKYNKKINLLQEQIYYPKVLNYQYFKKNKINQNQKIIEYSNLNIQLNTLIKYIRKTNDTFFVIILNSKISLKYLLNILWLENLSWKIFLEDNFLTIETLIKNKSNIIITNAQCLNRILNTNTNIINKNKIEILIIDSLFTNEQNDITNKFSLYITNQTKQKNIVNIRNQSQKKSDNTNDFYQLLKNTQKIINKEYIYYLNIVFLTQYVQRIARDIQKMPHEFFIYFLHYLKNKYLFCIYKQNTSYKIKKNNNYFLWQSLIEEIFKKKIYKKDINLNNLGIHIQKKNKILTKKESYNLKILSIYQSQYINKENFSLFITKKENFYLPIIQFIAKLNNEINYKKDKKTIKNELYLYFIQLSQIYQDFILELIHFNLTKSIQKKNI
uniref:Orf717 n=1 Tax=Reclinomonas americana TaxID=48483 RepID=O21283_RECAM|nr:Orf717 [Reclinomonas americana]AAD11910.1 Orf717 [Reclinomonas americana]